MWMSSLDKQRAFFVPQKQRVFCAVTLPCCNPTVLRSSAGEASAPDDVLWLMARAGYKPVIDSCGGLRCLPLPLLCM